MKKNEADAQADAWIPTAKEKPPKGKKVIVAADGDVFIAHFNGGANDEYVAANGRYFPGASVVAWMPRPAYPR